MSDNYSTTFILYGWKLSCKNIFINKTTVLEFFNKNKIYNTFLELIQITPEKIIDHLDRNGYSIYKFVEYINISYYFKYHSLFKIFTDGENMFIGNGYIEYTDTEYMIKSIDEMNEFTLSFPIFNNKFENIIKEFPAKILIGVF